MRSIWWMVKSRGNCYCYLFAKVGILIVTVSTLIYTCLIFQHTVFQPTDELFPLIQFDRGGFSKADILDSSQHAIRVLSKLSQGENSYESDDEIIETSFNLMKNLLDVEDRKTRRQLLALEALGMSSQEDFDVLSSLGYNKPTSIDNATSKYFLANYSTQSEIIEHRPADFKRLCFESTFTIDNHHRNVDKSFCSRLRNLEQSIKEGRDVPLLTIFTWWLDPINDGEILSRKTMICNWNVFRPFIIPVIFTNHRMNMAFANGNGWPCFPVTETNSDGLPVFRSLSRVITSKFKSTFYGYAKPIALFDPSLLETLMAMKDQHLLSKNASKNDHISTTPRQPYLDLPLVIHGSSVNMSHLGHDPFVNFEHLYKYLRDNTHTSSKKFSVEKSNYVFFRGADFANMPPLVINDDFLVEFVIDFAIKQDWTIIDASKTLFAIRTYRFNKTNEWSRRYLVEKPPDFSDNKRLATVWYTKYKLHQKLLQRLKFHIVHTQYNLRNGSVCLMSGEKTVDFKGKTL